MLLSEISNWKHDENSLTLMRINYKICHLPVIYTPVSCHIKEKQHENFRKQKNIDNFLYEI